VSMKSNLITYITNWDRVNDDVLQKEKSLLDNKIDYFVMNSSSTQKDEWLNIGTNAWCYRQLYEIFKHAKDLDYEFISVLFGDIYCPDGTTFSDYVKETNNNINTLPECYVYSTSFTHDGWSYPSTVIRMYDDDVSYVCGVDTLYLTVHREIALIVYKFLKYFDKKHGIDNFSSGWAVDVLCSAFSIYYGKNVFRNTSSILIHYENSGYDVGKAYGEMSLLISEAVYFWDAIGNNGAALKRIIDMMFEQRVSREHTYEDFYGVTNANKQ